MEAIGGLDLVHFQHHGQAGPHARRGDQARLHPAERHRHPATEAGRNAGDPATRPRAAQLAYRRAEKASLLIETQDGDTVRLRFKSIESARLTVSAAEDGETALTDVALRARQSIKLAVFVKGDLDAEELSAIGDVVAQAGALAEAYFSGNLDAAFAAAGELNIDGQQLASAALRLRIRETLTYTGQPALSALAAAETAASRPQAALPTLAAVSGDETAPAAASDAAAATEAAASASPPTAGGQPLPAAADAAQTQSSDAAAEGSEVPEAAETETGAAGPAGNFLTAVLDFLSLLIDSFDDVQPADPAPEAETPPSTPQVGFSLKLRIFTSLLLSATVVAPPVSTAADGEAAADDNGLDPLLPAAVDALIAERQAATVETA
jgi:hypothetical protein